MQTTAPKSDSKSCCEETKPGFFARIWQKIDDKMKAKAEEQEKSSCCCGCGDGESQKAKTDKCC